MKRILIIPKDTKTARYAASVLALAFVWLAQSASAHADPPAPDAAIEPVAEASYGASQAPGAPGTQPAQAPHFAPHQAVVKAPDKAKNVCLWGRPRSQCKSSPLLELTYGPTTDFNDDTIFSFDGGWLFNRVGPHAVGATAGVMCKNPGCNVMLKGRYRYYLAKWVSLDVSPGFYAGGSSQGLHLDVALQLSDFIAVVGGYQTTSSRDGFDIDPETFVAFRAGLPLMLLAAVFAGG